jgi:ribonuclease D
MAEPLLAPYNGIPKLVETIAELQSCIDQILSGTGPIAIDAERASGYRYSARAYLIQIKRTDGGLHLIDPIAVGPTKLWRELSEAVGDAEWIIHASTQDLACLREVGIEPKKIFDTELGGRIAGCERVGLGPLTEELLDIQLAKEHSAVDWSLRPLREEWLNYAALDVELLVELRDKVAGILLAQGKLGWAEEDFASILKAPPAPPRTDPWRRTSGMHKVRDRLTLGVIRELWLARDAYARQIDIAPGRVFNDETLMEIVTKRPNGLGDFRKIILRRTRVQNSPVEDWYEIFTKALTMPFEEQPELRIASTALPPVKVWQVRNPLGYARITHARSLVLEISTDLVMAAENLISPEAVRRVCWANPSASPEEFIPFVESTLAQYGARKWQIRALAPALAGILTVTEPLITPEEPDGDGATSAQE